MAFHLRTKLTSLTLLFVERVKVLVVMTGLIRKKGEGLGVGVCSYVRKAFGDFTKGVLVHRVHEDNMSVLLGTDDLVPNSGLVDFLGSWGECQRPLGRRAESMTHVLGSLILCHERDKDLLGVPVEQIAKVGVNVESSLEVVLDSSVHVPHRSAGKSGFMNK